MHTTEAGPRSDREAPAWLDRAAYPFTSRWCELPDGHELHYVDEGSGPTLLLAHGTMDNNVPPTNTLLVVDALIKANKDFDLLMLPNQPHGYGNMSNYMARRRWDYFVKNLLGAEPPKEYELGPKPRATP